MRNKVEITIAGRKYKIACPVGQESALFAAASELDQRLTSFNKTDAINTPEQVLMMVALNLVNELLVAKQSHEKEREATQSKIALLQSTIEQALGQHNKSA
ncbi:cell division protein ZapA [Colwellia sp. MEBiC06753]